MPRDPGDMICTVAAADSLEDLRDIVAAAETRFVELRLDRLREPLNRETVRRVAELVEEARSGGKKVIATLRDRGEGGGFTGPPAVKEEILLRLAEAGSDFIDVELSFPLRRSVVEGSRRLGVRVIMSIHMFDRVPEPGELRAAAREAFRLRANLLKAVFPARRLEDNVVALNLCDRWRGRVISFCLGRLGVASRVMAPLFGAPFTYAYPEGSKPVAPGQLSVGKVIRLWRLLGIV